MILPRLFGLPNQKTFTLSENTPLSDGFIFTHFLLLLHLRFHTTNKTSNNIRILATTPNSLKLSIHIGLH